MPEYKLCLTPQGYLKSAMNVLIVSFIRKLHCPAYLYNETS